MPAPALTNWAGSATAEYALDNWERLAAMPPSERLKAMKAGRYEARDAAADRGREVHKLAERLSHGETVVIPEGLEGYVQSCIQFLDDLRFTPLMTETVAYNETHRYVGTFDAYGLAELPDIAEFEPYQVGLGQAHEEDELAARILIDYKTSRSGIFAETAYQLTGYQHCEWIITDEGEVEPMPPVDLAMGVHLTPNGYSLKIADTGGDAFRDFLIIQQMARIADKDEKAELLSHAFTPPHVRRFKLTEES